MSNTVTIKLKRSPVRRVEEDDSNLTHLLMCEPPTPISPNGARSDHLGLTYLTTQSGRPSMEKIMELCNAIGRNTHLQDICFDCPGRISDLSVKPEHFDGLRRNTSVTSVGLSRCDLARGLGYQVLKAFEENGEHSLKKLAVWRCLFFHNDADALISTVTRHVNLTDITLTQSRIDDSIIKSLVAGIKSGGHSQIEKIDLKTNNVGGAGAKALATLVSDPESKLKTLNLHDNRVDTEGAIAIAHSLTNNRTLEAVYLDMNDDISYKGWNAFIKPLCDTSSIEATYNSNHTLFMVASWGRINYNGSTIYDEDDIIPYHLMTLLQLNGQNLNRDVARKKIIQSHFVKKAWEEEKDLELGPIVDDEKVLPHLLAWAGRSDDPMSNDTTMTYDTMSFSAMYTLVHQMPTLICPRAKPRVCSTIEAPPLEEGLATTTVDAGTKRGPAKQKNLNLRALFGAKSLRKMKSFVRK